MITNSFPDEKYLRADKPANFPSVYPLAREALFVWLKDRPERKVYLPTFCPEGVFMPYKAAGYETATYEYDPDFRIRPIEPDRNSIFHYIHPFGLYISENIDYLEKVTKQGILSVDDRALTLFDKPYRTDFSAELYSVRKFADIPFGGLLKSSLSVENPDPKKPNRGLIREMRRVNARSGGNIARKAGSFGYKAYYKFFVREKSLAGRISSVNYENSAPVTEKYTEKAARPDYKKIAELRRNNTELILNELHPDSILPCGKQAYTAQSILGVPLKVSEPDDFRRFLMKNGFLGFTLQNGWNPFRLDNPHPYANRHYCLPNHHRHRKEDMERLIETVNKYFNQ